MIDDRNRIREALLVIKDTCENHQCKDCPFSNDNLDCMITASSPYNWNIEQSPDLIWRALK